MKPGETLRIFIDNVGDFEAAVRWARGDSFGLHLDREMVGLLHATNALLGEDEYCMDYITAFREGRIGPKKD